MRLIDADALKEELRNSWIRKAKMPMEADPFLAFAMSDIDNAHTIDAEPIVRCKDCKHWNSETKGCKRNPSVEEWCNTDYCSYGERKGATE